MSPAALLPRLSAHTLQRRPHVQTPNAVCRPAPAPAFTTTPHRHALSTRCPCTADSNTSSDGRGNNTPFANPHRQQNNNSAPDTLDAAADDPVAAMLAAAQQAGGYKIVFEDEEGYEDMLDDMLEDLEDPWMRNPSPPEWSESPLFAEPGAPPTSRNSNEAATEAGDPSSTPSLQFATVNWQQLQQMARAEQQQQRQQQDEPGVVLLEVLLHPEGQQQQQQHQHQEAQQQPTYRPLPDPLPLQQWLGSSTDTVSQQSVQEVHVQRVSLALADVTREAAAAWPNGIVAVWDSGHHSSLAAAIRLSAVYRVPRVVLLQEAERLGVEGGSGNGVDS